MISIRKEYVDVIRQHVEVKIIDEENELGFVIDPEDFREFSAFVTTMENFSQYIPISPIPDISKIYIDNSCRCYYEDDGGIHRFDNVSDMLSEISAKS